MESSTDMASFLRSLEMKLLWREFDVQDIVRIAQLINKTNQFNLTTRRYNQAEVRQLAADPAAVTLQIRLLDRFGDNGIVAVVIGAPSARDESDLIIEAWLMSCRVLGRELEVATLNVLAELAGSKGFRKLIGSYLPSARNRMTRDHYPKLGFEASSEPSDLGETYALCLEGFEPAQTSIETIRAA